MVKIRIHLDDTTVDLTAESPKKAQQKAESILADSSIWVTPTRLYPTSRIVFIEIM